MEGFGRKKGNEKVMYLYYNLKKFKKCFNFDVQKLQEKQEIQIILNNLVVFDRQVLNSPMVGRDESNYI